jgi:FkbM family methyltransferase
MIPGYISGERFELERVCRASWQAVRFGPDSILCRVLGKYLFYTDPEDVGITPHLCMDGFWESWITIAIARQLHPGWQCVDIGANCGYYTVLMADAVGELGRVLAVEPNPILINRLQLNLEINGLSDRVVALGKAAAQCSGSRALLVVPPQRSLNGTIARVAASSDRVFEVETITLDDATRDWSCVDLVKIDAEGAEESIWRGMQHTVRKNPDLRIIVEFNPLRPSAPRLFLEEIAANGFRLRHIDFDGSLEELTLNQILDSDPVIERMLFLHRD